MSNGIGSQKELRVDITRSFNHFGNANIKLHRLPSLCAMKLNHPLAFISAVFSSFAFLTLTSLANAEPGKPYGNTPNGSTKVAGREWLRCSIGQTWSGSSCTGAAKEYAFEEAKAVAETFNARGYSGKRDWRVPTVRELQTLRLCSTGFDRKTRDIQDGGSEVHAYCNDNAMTPTINTELFPQTSDGSFWSSSPSADQPRSAWDVNFKYGSPNSNGRINPRYVRLVRGEGKLYEVKAITDPSKETANANSAPAGRRGVREMTRLATGGYSANCNDGSYQVVYEDLKVTSGNFYNNNNGFRHSIASMVAQDACK